MSARYRPAVVITDIKMPVMDGLELISRCNEQMADAPSFIVLTSHDDFDFVRKALRENVVDYLIKLELTAETLKEAIEKIIGKTGNAPLKIIEEAQNFVFSKMN